MSQDPGCHAGILSPRPEQVTVPPQPLMAKLHSTGHPSSSPILKTAMEKGNLPWIRGFKDEQVKGNQSGNVEI